MAAVAVIGTRGDGYCGADQTLQLFVQDGGPVNAASLSLN